ncbi:MAG: hypothetical protein KTR31_17710 [Myxococcales bacterium]|nr:hypothetical protein [Myxococcales bacterium]
MRAGVLLSVSLLACRPTGQEQQDSQATVVTVPAGDSAGSTTTADTGPVPQPIGEAQVLVFQDGVPLSDTHVASHTADGRAMETVRTFRDGRIGVPVYDNGIVTVLLRQEDGWYGILYYSALSIFDVQPGDELLIGDPTPPATIAPTTTSFTLDAPGEVTGAKSYRASVACHDVTLSPPTLRAQTEGPALTDCTTDGHTDAVLTARGTDGELLAAATVRDLPLGAGSVQVHPKAWDPLQAMTHLSASSIDDGELLHHSQVFATRRDWDTLVDQIQLRPGAPDVVAFQVRFPSNFAESWHLSHHTETPTETQRWSTWVSTLPATIDVDRDVPYLHIARTDVRTDEPRAQISIAASDAQPSASALVVTLGWHASSYQDALSSWWLIAPPDTTELTQPELPASWGLTASPSDLVDASTSHVSLSQAPDYAAYRTTFAGYTTHAGSTDVGGVGHTAGHTQSTATLLGGP